MQYDIQVLKRGQCEVPGPEVYWMSNWKSWEVLYFWMVLIRGNNKNIIINTGPPRDLAHMNSIWSEAIDPRSQFIRSENERPEQALPRCGISPSEIDYVLITPLQAYATGNIALFPNATVCISRRGWIEVFPRQSSRCTFPANCEYPMTRSNTLRSTLQRSSAYSMMRKRYSLAFVPFGQVCIIALQWLLLSRRGALSSPLTAFSNMPTSRRSSR